MLAWVLKTVNVGRLGVALILAIVVWGYVIATQYPEETITFNNVPVNFVGFSTNLVPRQYSAQVVKVTINGAKEKVNLVQLGAILPVMDLKSCTKPITCIVPIRLKQMPDNVSNYTIEPESIQVQLENVISKDLNIQINKVGTVKLGYQQDEIRLDTNVVKVSGPESLVDRVKKAEVTISLNDRDSSLQGQVPVVLLDDKNQSVLDKELELLPINVNVTVPITFKLNAKTVPIRVVTTGSPAYGYVAGSSIKVMPTLVTINGDPTDLGPIEYVETRPVALDNATTTVSATVLLRVPENTVLSTKSVAVEIGITMAQASIPVRITVEVVNPPLLRYELRPNVVTITLQGSYQLLQPKLPLDQIKVKVDLAGMGAGTFEVPLLVETPEGLEAVDLPKITVIILAPTRATATPLPPPTLTATQRAEPFPTAYTPAPSTPPVNSPLPALTPTPLGLVNTPTSLPSEPTIIFVPTSLPTIVRSPSVANPSTPSNNSPTTPPVTKSNN